MMTRIAAAALAAILAAGPAASQESSNKVAESTDWSVFVESDPAGCWGVSAPSATANTRDGRPVQVRRGDVLLFVAYLPDRDIDGQVSFTGGYPFAEGSTVSLDIGGTTYELFTEGEWAWAVDESQDAQIVESMKRGAEAVLVGRSSRGTRTQDTFSLMGFTAALEEAKARCAS